MNNPFRHAALSLVLLTLTLTGCDKKEEPTATPPGISGPPATREAATQPSTKP